MNNYHHGDLPRQLLYNAAIMASEKDPDVISLRELARRTSVSHSAPVHHFGTRKGLLTALALEGFTDLNETISDFDHNLQEMGIVYVQWALAHPGHYAVMWRPHLLEPTQELVKARQMLWNRLSHSVSGASENLIDQKADSYAAFALVHGLSSLWLSEVLPKPDNSEQFIRAVTQRIHLGAFPEEASVFDSFEQNEI